MSAKKTHVRYFILFLLFFMTTVNYADRATLSIAGTAISKDLGLTPIAMGLVFSAFGWAYVLGQVPGGWLLDRYGSKRIYGLSLLLWSSMTFLQGFVGSLSITLAVTTLFTLRFILGLVESPAFPANGRITASWFPTAERGLATSIFNSAQYFAVVLFSPIMGWVTHSFGWKYIFLFMGGLGLLLAFAWFRLMHAPKDHPRISPAELAHIEQGGGLVDMDNHGRADRSAKMPYLKELLCNRMLVGVYIGQYCITALTYFFITWFPMYLVQGRGMNIMQVGFVAVLPALCGFVGGISGGLLSDLLLKRGVSLTWARKTPFVIGMSLATSLVLCNYIDSTWLVVTLMALAFFGKGLSAIGWAVIADASPKELIGMTGGLFNSLGNIAGIVTPIVIGYILAVTGSYDGALWFVAAHSVLAVLAYLFIVGKIQRVVLNKDKALALAVAHPAPL